MGVERHHKLKDFFQHPSNNQVQSSSVFSYSLAVDHGDSGHSLHEVLHFLLTFSYIIKAGILGQTITPVQF